MNEAETNVVVRLDNICRSFQQGTRTIEVLKNISLDVEAGQSVGILGLETWGNFPDRKNFESYRVFTEFSSTTCGIFSGQSKYGCAFWVYLNHNKN